MLCHRSSLLAGTFALLAALVQSAAAQTPPAGGHVHYAEPPEQQAATGPLAPRLQNLGTHTFPVSTRNREAQLFMNQGLNLAYAFNHAEARRAFREAARLDPNLAMAYWGQALVLGPNINALMEPNEEPQAYELVQKALSLKSRASAREQAYIDALAQRYSGSTTDRTSARSGVRRCDARGPPPVSAGPRRCDAVRRIGDGSAAVGILAARRDAA